jgi:SAM-dependent methyltransferase
MILVEIIKIRRLLVSTGGRTNPWERIYIAAKTAVPLPKPVRTALRRLIPNSIRPAASRDYSFKSAGGFRQKQYSRYEDYRHHQRSKLSTIDLSRYDQTFREALRDRLRPLGMQPGTRVLCLAARIGTEVKAFVELGCFAIGIDLNPGKDNRYVVVGDFHDLQFAPRSIDVIYTNSLDHAFDLEKILSECRRVLTPGGILIVEACGGFEEGYQPGHYEALSWAKTDDLVDRISQNGFRADAERVTFEIPWPGRRILFRVVES